MKSITFYYHAKEGEMGVFDKKETEKYHIFIKDLALEIKQEMDYQLWKDYDVEIGYGPGAYDFQVSSKNNEIEEKVNEYIDKNYIIAFQREERTIEQQSKTIHLLQEEYLLAKSDGVKDCVKWLVKRIKSKQKEMNERDWYYVPGAKEEMKAAIDELIEVKISLEKYSKKLKHQANDLNQFDMPIGG